MNRDDIIRMADKAKFEICSGDGWPDERRISKLVRFAALVAAAEREACAKLCDVLSKHPEYASEVTKLAAQAIRARG